MQELIELPSPQQHLFFEPYTDEDELHYFHMQMSVHISIDVIS